MNGEIALRKAAVRRWLAGESKATISRALGRSHGWVRYWLARYDPDDPEGSLQNRSRAPHEPYRKWPESVRTQARQSRALRMAAELPGYAYALIGAQAIHYEFDELGLQPAPPVRTIHAWLQQAGLIPSRQPVVAVVQAAKPYPLPVRQAVNDLHQVDLKGPFYLSGSAQKHYLLALRDFASKGVVLCPVSQKRAQAIAAFLVQAWQQRGLPKVLQMDNGLEFRGSNRYPRSFGQVVRLCLDLDVEPFFVPPREPWRNGFIENFNGQFKRFLLNRRTLDSFAQLQTAVASLQETVNSTHRLAALQGQTPDEFVAGQPLRHLDKDYDGHQRDLPLVKGTISFVRLVRNSGRITLCAQDKFAVDPNLKWQYVLAQVDVQSQLLHIYHAGELIKTYDYAM
jgi:putative transposase